MFEGLGGGVSEYTTIPIHFIDYQSVSYISFIL